eukprot:scaffold64965_cov79-Cyclotella_meneghiniana.AAC.14
MNEESVLRNTTNEQDEDLQDENLDLFLSLIESRLRADFTSIDLTRLISTQGVSSRGTAAASALPSGNASSPRKFLRLICKVFHRAAKPVKLRMLMSVLGLDSDRMIDAQCKQVQYDEEHDVQERKTDEIVWQLLEQAEHDDEKWVRVVAGILKGIMFKSSYRQEVEDVNYYADPKCRGETAETELRKVSGNILKSVQDAHSAGMVKLSQAESSATVDDETSDQRRTGLNSLLLCKDACPTFIPYRYSLLPAETIKTIVPDVDMNNHFTANMDASLFKVDAEVEEKRAEEEGKELQLQIQRNVAPSNTVTSGKGSTASTTGGRGPIDAIPAGRMRGRFSNTAGRGGDRGSSLFLKASGGHAAAAGRMNVAGRSGSLGRLGGRSGTAGRLSGAAGRGRATALVGQTAVHRRAPVRSMLNSSSRGGSDASKMKMIDVTEVQGLTRAQNEREKLAGMTKAERRKKLLEDAAASGLRNNKKARVDTSITANSNSSVEQNGATEANSLHQQNDSQQQTNELGSLLEKSNKLSSEDRIAIHEFFSNRASINPHPEGDATGDLWKVKLNEERTTDPTTGENVKETLYLELDYRTRLHKKTKKIKRK